MSQPPPPLTHEAYLQKKFLPELDGLRALAVVLVIGTHMREEVRAWTSGWLGVIVFFVLSGYLITRLALIEERKEGFLNQKAFLVRRVCRLFPLYYLVLAVNCVLVFGTMTDPGKRAAFRAALPYYLVYLQELPFKVEALAPHGHATFFHSWTLGIEEKFYLLWPFVGFVFWRGRQRLRRWGTFALMVGVALAPVYLAGQAVDLVFPYSTILVGCWLALILDDPVLYERVRRILGHAWVGGGILAGWLALHVLWSFLPRSAELPHAAVYAACAGAGTTVLILRDGPVQWFLRRPLLLLVGRLSYGMYLIHPLSISVAYKLTDRLPDLPASPLVTFAVATLVTVAGAYPLKRLVEDPGIAFGRRLSQAIIRRGAARRAASEVERDSGVLGRTT